MSDYLGSFLEVGGVAYERVCGNFDKALSNLNKMPRLWLMYIEFLAGNRVITRTRLVLNRSLQALPVTQHVRVWDLLINKFIAQEEFVVPISTCKVLFTRYLEFEPEYLESYISYLISRDEITEAVVQMIHLIEDKEENVTHANFFRLVELISKNANKIDQAKIPQNLLPSIIRTGLAKFPDEQGTLWNALSDYYIRRGLFEKAVEIYELALDSISTVIDFSIVFDSYQNFLDLLLRKYTQDENGMADLQLERLELLLERRDEILSSVILRGNPNNVNEWIKRTKLPRIAADESAVLQTFSEALGAIDHSQPILGRISSLWIEFGKYFYKKQDLAQFRQIFNKAVQYTFFRSPDDLASVWIQWILLELHLTLGIDNEGALVFETARRAISQYRGATKGTVQANLSRSVKLWHLVMDIEHAKPEIVRGIYDSMVNLQVLTPQTVLNYAQYELDRSCIDKSAQALEKAVSIFPHVADIWVMYLQTATELRKNGKIFSTERVRDLFEQVLSICQETSMNSEVFYFLYAQFESMYGMARNVVAILLRGAFTHVGMYYWAIAESVCLLGASAARPIFERAIAQKDAHTVEFCMAYAQMEQELGCIDRARGLYVHASQFANPATHEEFWTMWKTWELEFGSEESYKEMKRRERAIQVMYSDKHFNTLDAGMESWRIETMQSIEVLPETPAPGIDISKLKQMAAQRKNTNAYQYVIVSFS